MARINNKENIIVNFSSTEESMKIMDRDDIFEPNEESFHLYCKSIGIPNKSSDILSSFLDKAYTSISRERVTTDEIKASIFNALGVFRSLSTNRWGTTKVPELKRILNQREKELIAMHDRKLQLDKAALRRANLILYLGGTIMISQFSFIMGGTYLFFCWDVMEPMAYLMLTSNLATAFGYYWWSHTELDFEPLQGRFKSKIAKGIYRRNKFDYYKFKQLQDEVIELRDLINHSV